jgi:hypothetical protein
MSEFNTPVILVRAVNLKFGTFHEVVTWEGFLKKLNPNEWQIIQVEYDGYFC